MKTIEEIKQKKLYLESKRLECMAEREKSKTTMDYSVNNMCVIAYAQQEQILEWVLNESV